MPPRVSYIPTHAERTALHVLGREDLPLARLGKGETMINKMIAKGWIVRIGFGAKSVYRITLAGEAALKEKISTVPRTAEASADIGLKAKK